MKKKALFLVLGLFFTLNFATAQSDKGKEKQQQDKPTKERDTAPKERERPSPRETPAAPGYDGRESNKEQGKQLKELEKNGGN